MGVVRWGIIGTGGIAHRFAAACKNTPGVELAAVASRSSDTAKKFADEFGIENAFGSYEELARSDCADIIYIGTPHGCHAENAMLCMNNKKGVLCEKPITLNSRLLEEMIACARRNDVFLMEAMWGRLVPGTKKLVEIVESGRLGTVKGLQASFCYDMSDEPNHHAFKPLYGGGSLLDVGCYGLYFSSWYAGSRPVLLEAAAEIDKTCVDVHCCVTIKYESGALAQLSSAMLLRKPNVGYVFGTKGYARVERFYAPQKIELFVEGCEPEVIDCPYLGNGFEEQILEASQCLREGKKQSDINTLDNSKKIMAQMDEIRKQIGLAYPAD